jgi:3-oxoacyl-(acyl-carrier-protein) synthase
MRRVVVTGIGTVSSLGNNKEETASALREGRSGIEFIPQYEELGFRSQIGGTIDIDIEEHIDRKLRRFMGSSSAYNYIAMQEAVEDSGLDEDMVSNPLGFRRCLHRECCTGSGSATRKRRPQGRPLHGAKDHVQHHLCLPCHAV